MYHFYPRIILILAIILSSAIRAYPQPATDSLLKVISAAASDTVKVKNYLLLGEAVYNSQPEQAREYWQKALSISNANLEKGTSEKKFFRMSKAAALNNLAFLFNKDGKLKEALDYLDESEKLEMEAKNEKGLIEPYNLRASILEAQGKVDEALEYYLKSLAIAQRLGTVDNQVMILNNIGYLHNQQGNRDNALKYYSEALEKVRTTPNRHFTGVLLNNIGKIYTSKDQPDSALAFYEEAAIIFRETDNPGALLKVLNNQAMIYSKEGDKKKALKYFDEGLALAQSLNYKEGIVGILNNKAGIYIELNNYAAAEQLYLQAEKIGSEIGWILAQKNTAEGLSKLYRKQGDHKKALEYTLHLMQLKDSLLNKENQKAIAEMETKYQAEKKQLEIDNLEKGKALDQAALAQKEEEVKRQNIQKLSFAGGLALMLVISVLTYRSYAQKKSAHAIISLQKQEVEHQKLLVEEKNREVSDSINYAKRIQNALLQAEEEIYKQLPPHFILFKPKDVVSGDFYWAKVKDQHLYVCAADCTGHGVPGAFMSLLGIAFLNEIISSNALLSPAQVLDRLREKIIKELGQKGRTGENKDGMDISLLRIDLRTREVEWSGANNPLWIVRAAHPEEAPVIIEIKPDKQPIGFHIDMKPFANHAVRLEKNDALYMFSDGYADQFGGAKGKKFKYSKMKELLVSMRDKEMSDQKNMLDEAFESWRGTLEQVDDVCIIGLKMPGA